MFPLLSLPYLAINNVLDMVYPNELFILSICSKKMYRLIKHMDCVPKRPGLKLRTSPCVTFSARSGTFRWVEMVNVLEIPDIPENKILEEWKIGSSKVLMEVAEHGALNTYWNDRVIGMAEVVNYGMDLFEKPIKYLSTGTHHSINEPIQTLDWIKSFQKSIFECSLHSNGKLSDDNITYFLNNMNVIDTLHLYVKPTNQYQFNSKSMDMRALLIKPSYWFNRKNLLSINCVDIHLEESDLSGNDINSFLHHWMNGGCPKLKHLWVCFNKKVINREDALKDLEVDESDPHLRRKYYMHYSYEFHLQFDSGFEIRNKESTATVLKAGDKSFIIVVWPDSRNNYF